MSSDPKADTGKAILTWGAGIAATLITASIVALASVMFQIMPRLAVFETQMASLSASVKGLDAKLDGMPKPADTEKAFMELRDRLNLHERQMHQVEEQMRQNKETLGDQVKASMAIAKERTRDRWTATAMDLWIHRTEKTLNKSLPQVDDVVHRRDEP